MEGCKRFVLDGGLHTQSPIDIIKNAFQELTELKAAIFGMYK
jgi:hypothetical protein